MAIVLISSVTLLAIGGGAAAYLVKSARESKQWAELASSTTAPAILMVRAFEEERRLSLLRLAGDIDAIQGLVTARQHSDAALAAVIAKGDAARELNPDGSAADIEGYYKLFNMVPTLRAGVDAQQMPAEQVFGFFTAVIGTIIGASMIAARVAPDARIAIELGYGVEPLRAAEALSQADTLGVVALTAGEVSAAQLLELNRLIGEFRGEVAYSATVLKGARLDQLNAITGGPAWQQVIAMQDAIMVRGPVAADITEGAARTRDSRSTPKTDALPMDLPTWQAASGQVNAALLKLWEDQSRDAHVIAREQGEEATWSSLFGGAVVLLIATAAFLAALVLANRFIGRMRRLRSDTLELADQRLPDLMRRLGEGESIDTEAEVARLDFGTDELGHVAEAFNRAHVAAVSAAVAEAKTRTGINAVFLNIAHRSQVVVHRQLALLDQAEREEKNAEQLELFFQLDHLATRARRNAENLIILGGEQPGRRWRNPVALLDLVRGAVAESLDYTRIQTGRMPEVRVASHAVADLIHLMAELTDNATAFSPPDSPVTVSGMVVGRGVAVEISDQGLGMSEPEYTERNGLLANPPDFKVATLSSDARLGLFVVAKLAARHGISVRLAESVYGGVRAVVLIPSALMEAGDPRGEDGGVDADPIEPAEPAGFGSSDRMPPGRMPARRIPAWEPGVILPAAVPTTAVPTADRIGIAPPPLFDASATRGDRPALPRRDRRAGPDTSGELPAIVARPRTADEARNLMSSIANGTRQGRRPRSESDGPTSE